MKQTVLLVSLSVAVSLPVVAGPSEQNGKVVFDKWCAPCHGSIAPRGGALPGTDAPGDRLMSRSIGVVLMDREISRAASLTRLTSPGKSCHAELGVVPMVESAPQTVRLESTIGTAMEHPAKFVGVHASLAKRPFASGRSSGPISGMHRRIQLVPRLQPDRVAPSQLPWQCRQRSRNSRFPDPTPKKPT